MIAKNTYVNEVLTMFRSADVPVLKIYTDLYIYNLREHDESDEDFIRRCAEQDYADGEDNLVFPEALEIAK